MPKSSNQKLKILYIAKILSEKTDSASALSTQGIISALAAYGIAAERKTIYDDIDALKLFGYDIRLIKGRGGGYYLAACNLNLHKPKKNEHNLEHRLVKKSDHEIWRRKGESDKFIFSASDQGRFLQTCKRTYDEKYISKSHLIKHNISLAH